MLQSSALHFNGGTFCTTKSLTLTQTSNYLYCTRMKMLWAGNEFFQEDFCFFKGALGGIACLQGNYDLDLELMTLQPSVVLLMCYCPKQTG